MKTLVLKELKENVRVSVLGLAIYTLVLLSQYRFYESAPTDLGQPLGSDDLVFCTAWFCGIFGAVLGWLQIHNERRPDLWAFLIHRPMTRTGIFLGKIFAGLCLYAVVVGAPLLGFIVWARLPGHVAAPFEIIMLRPVATYVLAGVLYYFAGMLADLRQARWYGSRVMGLGVAIVISLLLTVGPVFWQSFIQILVAAIILVTAVWGGFQSDGHYRGQPVWGKAALTAALMVGCMFVAVIAALLLTTFFQREERRTGPPYYCMTTNGVMCKVTEVAGEPAKIVDLEGKALRDEQPGLQLGLGAFNRRRANPISCSVDSDEDPRWRTWLRHDLSLVPAWRTGPYTLWYYWRRYGRLVGYDVATRLCIGSLGPKGFVADIAGGGDRFNNSDGSGSSRTLKTATTLYLVDPDKGTTKPLFTTTQDDPILAREEINQQDNSWHYTLVITKQFAHLLTAEGIPVWKSATGPLYPGITRFDLFLLEPPGQFALWIAPAGRHLPNVGMNPQGRVLWLAKDQGLLKTADLPALPAPSFVLRLEQRLISLVVPPALMAAAPMLNLRLYPAGIPRELLLLGWASVILVCLPIGIWLGLRYHFSLAAQAGWAVFLVVFGVPGLLAFLSVQEWPAREPCPNCKRPRLADRPRCEHCAAEWAPPEKTGTEVFEALQAG